MISYVRGPGGLWRRLGAEFVPFCIAGLAAWAGAAWMGPAVGIAAGLLVWLGTSFVLRAVRRHPRLCFVYRLALLAHVVFWSWQGIEATRAPTGLDGLALGQSQASAWSRAFSFEAGVATRPFALPSHATLAGWGSRPRRISIPPLGGFGVLGSRAQAWMAVAGDEGPRRPLFQCPDPEVPGEAIGARALVLKPVEESMPVAIVRLDLVTSDRRLWLAVHERVADLGFRAEGLLLVANHTHSGVGGYSRATLSALAGTDHFDPQVFDAIRDAAVGAIRTAYEQAEPARLQHAMTRDPAETPLGRLRGPSAGSGTLDDRVHALRFTRVRDDAPIATLVQYAVHPTLVRRRHQAFSRDLAGALEDALAAALPGDAPVLFVNGALGDVAPGSRHGSGPAGAKALAAEFAAAVAPALAGGAAADASGSARLQVAAVQRRGTLPAAFLLEGLGDRAALRAALDRPFGEGSVAEKISDVLALPLNALIWSFGVPEVRVGFSWSGAVGVGVRLEPPRTPSRVEVGAWELSWPAAEPTAPPHHLTLLWVPAEATTALGRAWTSRVEPEGGPTLCLGLTNGSLAYLTTPEEYDRGGYEAVATLYGPHAGTDLGEALWAAVEEARRLRWR